MLTWKLPNEPYIPAELCALTGSSLLARLLVQRGITDMTTAQRFLDPLSYQPVDAAALPDMDQAVSRLQQAIERQETICVWGDFDVDGQTSTALLVSMLQGLGAQVRYYIPNRMTESHGIKRPALTRILQQGVDLLLTCDTGIAEHEQIEFAQSTGTDVIVTDHHDLAETLPSALAIINPKRLPETHALRELPGVGVAYKVAEGLYQAMRPNTSIEPLLDLVALGIVADVAVQTEDTRYLLQRGLPVLSSTKRVGLQAIIENSRLRTERITEEHIGFWLGPRLNALGRLGDANLAVELLTTLDAGRAQVLAAQLEGMNDQRKLLVDQVTTEALQQIEQTPSLLDYNALILAAPNWHPGVIGIAASRLVEQFGKPTILISLDDSQTIGRGSARSVIGCDIHQAIKSQAELLQGFGGHPMAAGLSMLAENLTPFRKGVSEAFAGCLEAVERNLTIDAVVSMGEVSFELLQTIQRMAPFGQGNPRVMLACQEVHVVTESVFGKRNDHKKIKVADKSGQARELIWWGGAGQPSPDGWFDLAFTISADDFRGGEAVQLEWQAFRQPDVATTIQQKPVMVDWRDHSNPITEMTKAKVNIIWGEGVNLTDMSAKPRHKLQTGDHLVIWTSPPNEQIYRKTLKQVQPQRIYLVARPSPFDQFPVFIKQLMGLIKYALQHRQGKADWEALAAALGHDMATVQLGVAWLAGQGKLSTTTNNGLVNLKATNQPANREQVRLTEQHLKAVLAETAAYRAFFARQTIKSLGGKVTK